MSPKSKKELLSEVFEEDNALATNIKKTSELRVKHTALEQEVARLKTNVLSGTLVGDELTVELQNIVDKLDVLTAEIAEYEENHK